MNKQIVKDTYKIKFTKILKEKNYFKTKGVDKIIETEHAKFRKLIITI